MTKPSYVWDGTQWQPFGGAGASGAGLPAQAGQAGKYLTTDGTNASWAVVAGGAPASATPFGLTYTAADPDSNDYAYAYAMDADHEGNVYTTWDVGPQNFATEHLHITCVDSAGAIKWQKKTNNGAWGDNIVKYYEGHLYVSFYSGTRSAGGLLKLDAETGAFVSGWTTNLTYPKRLGASNGTLFAVMNDNQTVCWYDLNLVRLSNEGTLIVSTGSVAHAAGPAVDSYGRVFVGVLASTNDFTVVQMTGDENYLLDSALCTPLVSLMSKAGMGTARELVAIEDALFILGQKDMKVFTATGAVHVASTEPTSGGPGLVNGMASRQILQSDGGVVHTYADSGETALATVRQRFVNPAARTGLEVAYRGYSDAYVTPCPNGAYVSAGGVLVDGNMHALVEFDLPTSAFATVFRHPMAVGTYRAQVRSNLWIEAEVTAGLASPVLLSAPAAGTTTVTVEELAVPLVYTAIDPVTDLGYTDSTEFSATAMTVL